MMTRPLWGEDGSESHLAGVPRQRSARIAQRIGEPCQSSAGTSPRHSRTRFEAAGGQTAGVVSDP
jgi:hypothetical protein